MSIFSKNNTESNKKNENTEYNEFYCSDIYVDNTLIEMAQTAYQLESGLLIADLKSEESILEGAMTPEVVLEVVGGDFLKSAKDWIMKQWDKFVNFIKSIISWIKRQFTFGKKFAETYGADIKAKNVAGYMVHGFDYDMAAGNDLVVGARNKLTGRSGTAVEDLKECTRRTGRHPWLWRCLHLDSD